MVPRQRLKTTSEKPSEGGRFDKLIPLMIRIDDRERYTYSERARKKYNKIEREREQERSTTR